MFTSADDAAEGLALARLLAASGVPIFLAEPDISAGRWRCTGGLNGTGYWLPPGWQHTEADPAALDAWRPGMAVCAVMGHGLDALDIDPRSGGGDSHDRLTEAGHRPLVHAAASTPSGGRHELISSLGVGSRDALRPGLDLKGGAADGSGRGFVFLAPTVKVSKATGAVGPYGLLAAPDGGGPTPAEWLAMARNGDRSGRALAAEVDALRGRNGAHSGPSAASADDSRYDDLAEADRQRVDRYVAGAVAGIESELRASAGWSAGERDARGRGWEKLQADAAYRLARLALGGWNALDPGAAREVFVSAAPLGGGWTAAKMRAKWTEQLGQARRKPLPMPPTLALGDLVITIDGEDGTPDSASADGDAYAELLRAPGFWAAHPVLAKVRAAAKVRGVAPWAVLGPTLAIAAASITPGVVLPPTIGGEASLNLYVALCGESGSGKSGALAAAREVLAPTGPGAVKYVTAAPGTGEGLLGAYVGVHKDTASGKQTMRQYHAAVLLDIDEAKSLAALGDRRGATLVPFLTTMWIGNTVGTLNAEAGRRRHLDPQSYRLAIVTGCQPVHADVLLGDAEGGWPQRWLWLPTFDPDGVLTDGGGGAIEPTPWPVPGPGTRVDPTDPTGETIIVDRVRVMTLPAEAVAAIVAARRKTNRPIGAGAGADDLDGHALLTRAKVAGVLALLLDGALDVTAEHWRLAGVVMAVSDATRARMVAARSLSRALERDQADKVRGRGAAVAAAAEAEAHAARVAPVLYRALVRLAGAAEGGGGKVSAGKARSAAAGRDRQYADDALALLVARGALVMTTEANGSGRETVYYAPVPGWRG